MIHLQTLLLYVLAWTVTDFRLAMLGLGRAWKDLARLQQMRLACLHVVSSRRRRVIVIQLDAGALNCHLWTEILGDGECRNCCRVIWFPVDVDCVTQWTVVYDCVSTVRVVAVVPVVCRRRSRHVIVSHWVDCECVIVIVRYVR